MNVSVVIPAHNEANVLGRCLRALSQGVAEGEALEIIVVANGCRDATAQVAREHGTIAIETEVPSKSNALNLGDEVATAFPRIYLDADCTMTGGDVMRLARELVESGKPVASPRMKVDLANRGFGVRAFYEVWLNSSYVRENLVGSGAYMLSEAGRGRFERFPNLTADDAFIRLHYKADERLLSPTVSLTLTPPADVGSLIRIKTRAHFGNYELRRAMPDLPTGRSTGERRQWPSLLRQAARPWRWPKLAVYGYVMATAKREAARRAERGKPVAWERDESSRTPPPAATLTSSSSVPALA